MLLKQRYILLSLILVLASSSTIRSYHALYLSVTEIEFCSSKTSSLRVKVFSDDLQSALRNFSKKYQQGDLQHFFERNQLLAEAYFQQHLKLSVNNQPVTIRLESYSIENDAHFVTFRFKCPESIVKLNMKADFLMELFPTQTNIVKVLYGGDTSYLKFTSSSTSKSLTLTR